MTSTNLKIQRFKHALTVPVSSERERGWHLALEAGVGIVQECVDQVRQQPGALILHHETATRPNISGGAAAVWDSERDRGTPASCHGNCHPTECQWGCDLL